MIRHLHRTFAICLAVAALNSLLSTSAPAQTVWSGLTYSFTRPPNVDPDDPINQDAITDNVALTRASTLGLYNVAVESGYQFDLSPEYTLWATDITSPGETIAATNWANLTFADWRTAYGGAPGLATNILSYNAVVYLALDDIYLDLQFTEWSVGFGGGGGFAYLRSQSPQIPEPATWLLLTLGSFAQRPWRRSRKKP